MIKSFKKWNNEIFYIKFCLKSKKSRPIMKSRFTLELIWKSDILPDSIWKLNPNLGIDLYEIFVHNFYSFLAKVVLLKGSKILDNEHTEQVFGHNHGHK